MGISIGLAILPDRIDAGAWAAAYDDVVALLRAWPGGLLRLGTRTVRGRTVRAYHSEIETGEGEERRWKVEGDRATLRTAETHSMYRSLHRYHGGQQLDDALIALWRDCETPVLSSKTQDEPYHLPVLAAAMLIEDRFPCAAVAHGDIDSRDAAKAATWIEAVSGRRVVSPVCLDRSRLLARLDGRVGFHEIQEVVDGLHIKPMSPYEQGKWADLLGRRGDRRRCAVARAPTRAPRRAAVMTFVSDGAPERQRERRLRRSRRSAVTSPARAGQDSPDLR